MRMKKFRAVLLCALAALALAGCGGQSGGGQASPFSAVIDGRQVVCDVDAAPFLAAFGDGYEYSEAISCAYDGMDKIYMYPDFSISTYPQGDKDFVSEVELTSDKWATGKGIRVGSSRDEVLAAYGGQYDEEGITIVYYEGEKGGSASLYFIIKDGTVTGLGLTSPAAREE